MLYCSAAAYWVGTRKGDGFSWSYCCDKKILYFSYRGESRAQEVIRPGLPTKLQEVPTPCQVGQELMGHNFPKLACPAPRSLMLHSLSSEQVFRLFSFDWLQACRSGQQLRPRYNVQEVNPAKPDWQCPIRVFAQSKPLQWSQSWQSNMAKILVFRKPQSF